MFGFSKKKTKKAPEDTIAADASVTTIGTGQQDIIENQETDDPAELNTEPTSEINTQASSEPSSNALESSPQSGFFARVKKGLGKTRQGFTQGMADLLLGRKDIDDELLEEIETRLLLADVGVAATTKIIQSITEQVARKELLFSDALFLKLKEEMLAILDAGQGTSEGDQLHGLEDAKPYVLLMVGVNGVGKTTTIGKLAKRFQTEGKSVVLAAGDTFRAAAVEQLKEWGTRNDVPVVAQHTGADSASVVFDALQSAQAKQNDILIADTAGRLHNKTNLMDELAKVKRVLKKLDAAAPHEVMLVIDASTGQNAVNQVMQFNEAVGVDSLVLTKLDGTAKGGVVFAIAEQCAIPIKYIGVGEQIDDLKPFMPQEFVDALFDE